MKILTETQQHEYFTTIVDKLQEKDKNGVVSIYNAIIAALDYRLNIEFDNGQHVFTPSIYALKHFVPEKEFDKNNQLVDVIKLVDIISVGICSDTLALSKIYDIENDIMVN